MSSTLYAVQRKPVGYWPMGTTANFPDASGNGNTGTVSSAPNLSASLAHDVQYSTVLDSTAIGTFPCPAFQQGQEQMPFSLTAKVRVVNRTENYPQSLYRENLITNPSGEAGTTGWTAVSGATGLTTSTTRSISGTSSFTYVSDGSQNAGIYPASANVTNLIAGDAYTLSGWIFPETVTLNFYASLRWRTGTDLLNSPNRSFSCPAGQWTRIYITSYVPIGADNVLAMFRATNTSTAQNIFIDGLMLEKSASLGTYFDGSNVYPKTVWTGTANASISRTRSEISLVNLNANPSPSSTTTNGVVGAGSGTLSYVDNAYGTYSAPMMTRDNANNAMALYLGRTSTTNASVGNTYKGYAMVKVNRTGSFSIRLGNASTALTTKVVNLTADTWTAVETDTYDSPINQVININISQSAGVVGDTIMMTNAYLRNMNEQYNGYFDGNSAYASWIGAANVSASYVLASNGEQQILGNQNMMDGLVVNGSIISFIVKFANSNAPDARIDYDTETLKRCDIVGTYDNKSITLYVNGELVGKAAFTTEQIASKFAITSASLYSGSTTSSQGIMVNGIGVYWRALNDEDVNALYKSSYTPDKSEIVPFRYGGSHWDMGIKPLSISQTSIVYYNRDWESGELNNVKVMNDAIYPTYTNDVSMSGYWLKGFSLPQNETSIYGVNVSWQGTGINVEASFDLTNWESVYNGKNLDLLPPPYTVTNAPLFIRVSFPGGLPADYGYMSRLNLNFIKRGSASTRASSQDLNDRELIWTGIADIRNYQPVNLFASDWGTQLRNGNVIVANNASNPDFPIRTFEIWLRGGTSFSITSATWTHYRNGVASAAAPRPGEWTLVHVTRTSDQAANFTITGDCQIGRIAIYPTTLSAADVAAIYSSYMGTNHTTVADNSVISLSESTNNVGLYATDWTIK